VRGYEKAGPSSFENLASLLRQKRAYWGKCPSSYIVKKIPCCGWKAIGLIKVCVRLISKIEADVTYL
jgi:hypothetical protein